VTSKIVKDLKEAVENSLGFASLNDIILFSPAFASFGMFQNEYERNDLFIKIIKGLK
jgi:UDP-N-acetylmuramoylalanine--D-glutamate ligase